MFDWVPIQNYEIYFHLSVLICVIIALWQCHTGTILKNDIASLNAVWGLLLCTVLILYMGLRPISPVFADTANYFHTYEKYLRHKEVFEWEWNTEWLYYNLLHWWGSIGGDIHQFFLMNAVVYVGSLWLATVRIFKNYYYLPFLVILGMFTFWNYGVNGIRNGMGASLFILAMTYTQNIPAMISLVILGIGCHTSVALMAAAGGLAWFIKNSYYYLAGWIGCLGLSYAIGGRIQSFMAGLSFMAEEERFSDYLTGSNQYGELVFTTMTFRWDFVLYSAIGVALGYYFIFRRNYKDEYYHYIYNIYLTTNAFWLLIIRANFSNRFAQISWFILPLVLIYPFLRKRFWQNQEKVLAMAIIAFYAYGFLMNIIRTNAIAAII